MRYWGLAGTEKFNDSWQVLSWVDCQNGFNQSFQSCSNNYGYFLIFLLKTIGLTKDAYFIFGHLNIIIFALSISYLINKNNFQFINFFTLLLVFSPPVLLLLERGNLDGIIFGMLVFSYFLYDKKQWHLAYAIVLLTSLFKFYTLPLLIYIGFFKFSSLRLKIFYRVISILTGVYLIFEVFARQVKFPKTGTIQFGMQIWEFYLNKIGRDLPSSINLTICSLFFVFLLILTNFKKIQLRILKKPLQMDDAYFFLLVFAPLYLVGFNYDYRLVFFIAFIVEMFKNIKDDFKSNFMWIVLSALWLVYPARGLEPFGDLVLEGLVSFFVGHFLLANFARHKYHVKKST